MGRKKFADTMTEEQRYSYEQGYRDAKELAIRLFCEYLDTKMDIGMMYLDMEHIRLDKRWYSLWMNKRGVSTDKQHRIKNK